MTARDAAGRARAKTRVLDLLRRIDLAGDLDSLADEIIKVTLGVERDRVPPRSQCVSCGRTKVRQKEFKADPTLRAAGCVQHGRGDDCSACYARQRRGAPGPADPARAPRPKPGVVSFPISASLVAQLRAADSG